MEINLSELSYKDKIEINKTFSFPKEYLGSTEIQRLDDVKVEGYFYQNDLDEYKCRMNISGQMYLLDSNTLEEVPYNFDIEYDDEVPENCINEQNMLDIIEFLWENIVLEVPIRYTQSDAENLSGENWKVIDEKIEEDKVDPRMEKLYELYKGGE